MLRPRVPCCLLVLVGFALFALPVGAGPDRGADALARSLQSPVAAEREQAVREAVAAGGAARTWARSWVASDAARLRAGGWAVLAHVGVAADMRTAIEALADPQPEVASAAGGAVVRMAARLPLEAEPWVAQGALQSTQIRTLAWAVAARLDEAPAGSVPAWVTRLGEGLVPCLTQVLRHPRFDTGPRKTALAALAQVGGDAARHALSDLIPLLESEEDYRLWEAWWRALIEVGPGKGLEGAHALVVRFCEFARGQRGAHRPPGLRWRSHSYLYRFLATCPPAEGIATVRAYIDRQVRLAASSRGWRIWPSVAADIVRAHLVLAEPNDERLLNDTLLARPPPRHGWRRRQEELGRVLVHLEPYKARAGMQEGLAELLSRHDLPKTVRAWALYLAGETPPDDVRKLGADLIDAGGAAATMAERRLGARLLDRLGKQDATRIRAMLTDLDGWMRAMGLRWAVSAAAEGRFPVAERDAAIRKGLRDTDAAVFLLASELAPRPLAASVRTRLLEIAVGGPRSRRGRAWAVIDTSLGGSGSAGEDPFPAPGGHAALDARLRAAALALRLWDARTR